MKTQAPKERRKLAEDKITVFTVVAGKYFNQTLGKRNLTAGTNPHLPDNWELELSTQNSFGATSEVDTLTVTVRIGFQGILEDIARKVKKLLRQKEVLSSILTIDPNISKIYCEVFQLVGSTPVTTAKVLRSKMKKLLEILTR